MSTRKKFAFFMVLQLPVQTVAGYLIEFNWLSVLIVFLMIPVFDVFLGRDSSNPGRDEMNKLQNDRFFLLWPLLWIPIQLFLLIAGGYIFVFESIPVYEKIGLLISVSLVTGSGIIIAHEFGHRKSKWERSAAKILLGMVNYLHFYIEHNKGHHQMAATPDDPSSARLGENFYSFWVRSVSGSYMNAWAIENKRIKSKNLPWYRNQMTWFSIIPFFLTAVAFIFGGWQAVVYFLTQSFLAFSMLELINYIEHYGLTRKELSPGRFEKFSERHSWNANQRLSNIYQIHLERHSDHHANPDLRYQCLSHLEDSPQLPSGYGAMFPLALIPPLWFRKIDPLVESYRRS